MSREDIPEESFPSDEEFDDEEADSESSSDVDAKVAEDDVFDIDFFKCYSALKKKDDKIYDKNVKFFSEEQSSSSEGEGEISKKTSDEQGSSNRLLKISGPKMTLLDHQLNLRDEEIEELGQHKIDLNKPVSKSFYEKELEEIKKSIEKVSENVDSESDDDLLVVKGTQAGPSVSRPNKTIGAMLDKLEEDEEKDISHLKQIWSDPKKLTEEEKFLRDYILNKRYIAANDDDEDDKGKESFFSKNLEELSDTEDVKDEQKEVGKKSAPSHRSDEKDFDRVARIPRNSTKTIRDLVEKREKKEKRLKKLEKEKKRKKAVKDADFEDLVGDLPTKFHYRETEPNDYGLSAEELLMATDEELEKWVSLKDAIAYKSTEEELAEKKRFEQKRNDLEFKKKIFKSVYGDPPEGPSTDPETVSKAGKKRKRNQDNETSDPQEDGNEVDIKPKPDGSNKKKKKKHRGLNHKKFAKTGVAPDRLLSYGLSKTKLKKSKLL